MSYALSTVRRTALSLATLLLAGGAFLAPAEAQSPPQQRAPESAPRSERRAPEKPAEKAEPGKPDAGTAEGGKGAARKPPPPWALTKTPESPLERAKALDNLYAHLATADDEPTAGKIAETIERLWLTTGSETINVLMERSLKAVAEKKPESALKFLDSIVDLAPDFAEGWNRRAYVHYTNNDVARALGDLRRVLALDPNHFKALDGLGQILREIGQKKAALEAYRKLMAVHPFWKDGETVLKELEREVGGQGI